MISETQDTTGGGFVRKLVLLRCRTQARRVVVPRSTDVYSFGKL